MTDRYKNILLYAAIFVPVVLWRAFAAVTIYGWYAPFDWPRLTLSEATGLWLVTSLLVARRGPSTADPFDPGSVVADAVVGPALALLFAYVIRTWVFGT